MTAAADSGREATAATAARVERGTRERWFGWAAVRRLADLLALTGFAITQPVLDVTGRSPDFFLFRQPSRNDMRLFVAIVALVPPLAMWAAERAVGVVSRTAERALHLAFVALLFGLLVVQVGKQAGLFTGLPLAVVAAAAGVGLAVLVARARAFRQVLTYASPAPLVFVLVFTMTTQAGVLVRPASGESDGRAAARAAVSAKRPPIVFLLLDEFPTRSLLNERGEIDARLFPNFAKLAERSNWYPNATSMVGSTHYAVPMMLSGRYPTRTVAPSYVEYPENAFTLLAKTYDINAYEAISQLCPPATCTEVPAGRVTGLRALLRDVAGVAKEIASPYPAPPTEGEAFAEGIEEARAAGEGQQGKLRPTFMFGKKAQVSPERLTTFLADLKPSTAPTMHFLHLMLPHAPYRQLPSGRAYAEPAKTFPVPVRVDNIVVPDPELAVLTQQRLLLQVAYTDLLIGQVIERMEQTGIWDESMLIVTSDHGVGLNPGAHRRRLNDHGRADVAFVPLFVKTPNQRAGKVDPRNEQHVDLLPTIADVLDVQVPWPVDGVSLLGKPRETTEKQWWNDPNERVTFDLAEWGPRARNGLAPGITKPELGPRGLFAVGPLRPLFGRRVGELTVGPPSPVAARPVGQLDLDQVRTDGPAVPAFVWGELDGPAPRQRWLAAALNGTIAGSVLSVRGTDGKTYFMGMLDEAAFRDGRNDLVLYEVDGETLHPLRPAA